LLATVLSYYNSSNDKSDIVLYSNKRTLIDIRARYESTLEKYPCTALYLKRQSSAQGLAHKSGTDSL
jgi:hypothetical protein